MTVKDQAAKAITTAHRTIFKASKGRVFGKGFGMPVLVLTTIGRKSGKERETMLTAPIADDNMIVLVGSYGGDDREPLWFRNLRANPDVRVLMRGRDRELRARVATPDEKEALWPRVTSSYKGYAGYQTRTDRDIPLAILEERTARED